MKPATIAVEQVAGGACLLEPLRRTSTGDRATSSAATAMSLRSRLETDRDTAG